MTSSEQSTIDRVLQSPHFTRFAWGLAVVAFTIAIALWNRPHARTGMADAAYDGPATAGSHIAVIGPIGGQKFVDAFSWRPIVGAKSYEVTMSCRDTVWRQTTTRATLNVALGAMPDEVVTLLSRSETMTWDVAAKDASGKVIARSDPQKFYIYISGAQ